MKNKNGNEFQVDLSSNAFESAINETINLYDKYSIQQQLNQAKKRKISGDDRDEIEVDMLDANKENCETSDLFDKFIDKYNNLLKKITESKRHCYFQFMNTFQTTNLYIIKLYDFASKLLNLSIGYKFENDSTNNYNNLLVIISRTIELLHVLISSQNEDSDNDEYSLICCDQLTKSFNFTSSLSNLLQSYSIKMDSLVKTNRSIDVSKQSLLRDDKSFRMAFIVLNKMTLNNKLFMIDFYSSDFIRYSIDKLIQTVDKSVQSSHLQFISNIVRNNKNDIEEILVANKKYSLFCREISKLLKSQIGNLVLNGCIIFVKLCYEQILPTAIKIDTQIDIALNYLKSDKLLPNETTGKKNYDFTKENAANFLIDFFNRDQVIKFLELNEDYSNLIFFKLNQLLIENKPSKFQPALNTSLKVFKILSTLAKNSDKLGTRLFQIVFNTRKFLEQKEDLLINKQNQFSLTKKFKELILSNNNDDSDSKYEILIDYYIKAIKLSLNLPLLEDLTKTSENGALFIHNTVFYLNFSEYLLQLFKKNENFNVLFIETKINLLYQMLFENFKSLHKLFKSNLKSENNQVFENNKEYLSKSYFFTLSLIDSILKMTTNKQSETSEIVKNLFEMIQVTNSDVLATITSRVSSWSIISDIVILSEENILISCRVLMRFLHNNNALNGLKETVFKFYQEEHFLNLLSYAIIENDRTELTTLAYELLFDLHNTSTNNDFGYHFNFESFIKQNEKLKQQKSLNNQPREIENTNINNLTMNELPSNNNNDLTDLLNIYEYKLNEKKAQETQMINLLNQYNSNILLAESEAKLLRDKLRNLSQREIEAKKEKALLEAKHSEIAKAHQIFKESNAELNKQNQKLLAEKQKLTEQFEIVKKESEQMEKDNQDAIENLQNALKTEKTGKKELQTKFKETELKLNEIEKIKKSLDAKKKELESKLQTTETQLNEKIAQLTDASSKLSSLETQHETLKNDHEKLKSILSYVKENYK